MYHRLVTDRLGHHLILGVGGAVGHVAPYLVVPVGRARLLARDLGYLEFDREDSVVGNAV